MLSSDERMKTVSRIHGMKERMITKCPTELLPERALLVTEAYEENAAEPVVLKRACAFRKILEKMTIFIDEGELFVGHNSPKPRSPIACPELGARWILADIDTFATRPADRIGLSEENKKILKECLSKWQNCSLDAVTGSLISDEAKAAVADGMITVGAQGTAHGNIAINNKKLLAKGLGGIIDEINAKIEGFVPGDIEGTGKLTFWKAAKISCNAVIDFAHRYSDLAAIKAETEKDAQRKRELLEISAVLKESRSFRPGHFGRLFSQSGWSTLQPRLRVTRMPCCWGRLTSTCIHSIKGILMMGFLQKNRLQK